MLHLGRATQRLDAQCFDTSVDIFITVSEEDDPFAILKKTHISTRIQRKKEKFKYNKSYYS